MFSVNLHEFKPIQALDCINLNMTIHKYELLPGLIGALKSDNNLVVLSTDYVLTVMKEADLPANYSTKNLRRIFEVSGASLIVETELSGSTYNYQLKYTLHFKDDIKRGVIFEHNIHEALIQLTSKIAAYTDQSINELDK